MAGEITLYDAHCHLADPLLLGRRGEIDAVLDGNAICGVVVVGTSPQDWPAVLARCNGDARLIPAVGLHPWRVNEVPAWWREDFQRALDGGARVVGEVGLDRWIEDADIGRQQDAFRWQLGIAAERDLPVSIHCLRAWGPLLDTLESVALPARGVHLHAFGGSREVVDRLLGLGAVLSFNAAQMLPEKRRAREAMSACPADRLLVETDAPSMPPPAQLTRYPLVDGEGRPLNHPGNLAAGYRRLAGIRGVTLESLAASAETVFQRFFLA